MKMCLVEDQVIKKEDELVNMPTLRDYVKSQTVDLKSRGLKTELENLKFTDNLKRLS